MNFTINIRTLTMLGCTFFCWSSLSPTSLAQIQPNFLEKDEDIVFIPAKEREDPPSRGTPESEGYGAGSRGSCPYKREMPPLTSLVGVHRALSSTTKQHPSFWVYVPYTSKEISQGEFSLQEGDNDLYRAKVSLPKQIPGIVEIKLPKTSKPLEAGKEYRWYFELDCTQQNKQVDNSSTNGHSQRPKPFSGDRVTSYATLTGTVCLVESSPQFEHNLSAAKNPLEQIKVFAKYGIWHDTIAQLIKLRNQEPDNYKYSRLWQDLLSQPEINREQIINESFAGEANALVTN